MDIDDYSSYTDLAYNNTAENDQKMEEIEVDISKRYLF